LTILKAAWQKPYNPTVGGEPNICADFDRADYGRSNYRVATNDLNILKKHFNKVNKPDPNCQDVVGNQE
jgi:hypothetical protein